VAFAFHLLAFVLYLRVWLWHTTPAALLLPGATGFGWFFRYLTFCSYTLQLVQLAVCCMAHLTKVRSRVALARLRLAAPAAAHRPAAAALQSPARRARLSTAADRLSCAAFGIANTVTAMFYAVENTTQGLVEGGAADRPWWLAAAVHVLNSAVAWVDLFVVEERSFGGPSRHLALGLGLAYSGWMLVVRAAYGRFPYPVINALPFPSGYLGFASVGVTSVMVCFEVGRAVKHRLLPGGRARRRAARARKAQ
jgi:hypothetical protein